jgi:hypothetical protein
MKITFYIPAKTHWGAYVYAADSPDFPIIYTIQLSGYQASTAYVVLIKDDGPVVYIPTETTGQGFATVSRGFHL